MSTLVRPPQTLPQPIENAKRQYVELFGSALVLNTYLKVALVCVALVAVGLVGLNFWIVSQYRDIKPLVIRIDEVGRAAALQYDALTYQPREPEMKYFLTQFITQFYSRRRATVRETFPRSLLFLESTLAEALIAEANRNQTIEKFLVDTSDEVDLEVMNVTLSEIKKPPYRAAVDYAKVYYTTGTREERRRETYIAQVEFIFRDQVPADLIPVNPLGLTVTYIREDQAFREVRKP
jgi:type IV secretory pathway TrbF-like protein